MSVVVDYEELAQHEAHERLLRRLYEASSAERLLALRSRQNYHLIARVAGHVLGSAIAVPLEGKNAGIVQVVSLVVHPSQHRRGIGRSLLRALVQEARREHHRYVVAVGPQELLAQNEWDPMSAEEPVRATPQGFDAPGIPLEGWSSRRTRWIDPTPLLRIPDPEGLADLELQLKARDWTPAIPLR